MRRPFTKNTGNYIKGTEQIGDLSIGLTPFSQGYEGLTWWEGPEEDNVCIIAKDTTSKGSPVGNTGTVRFWGTGSTDEAFIGAVNEVSGQSFTTTGSCNTWLSDNGYWTNCGISFNPETYPTHSTLNVYEVGTSGLLASNKIGCKMFYSPTENEVYVNTRWIHGGPGTTYARSNAIIDISSLTSGNTYNITNHLPVTGTLIGGTLYNPSGAGIGDIDDDNNTLYLYCPNGSNGYLIDYDLSNSTINNVIKHDGGASSDLVYDASTDKIVFLDAKNEKIRVYNSDLSLYSSNLDAAGAVPNSLISNNKGQVLIIFPSVSQYRIYDIATNSYIKTQGSFPTGEARQGAYCPTTDKFYINYRGLSLYIIEGTDYTIETTLTLTSSNTLNIGTQCINVAYDSKRRTIWTFDAEGHLCAIDVENNVVLKRSLDTFSKNHVAGLDGETGLNVGGLVVAGDLLLISVGKDTSTPLSYYPVLAFDLNKIWPT